MEGVRVARGTICFFFILIFGKTLLIKGYLRKNMKEVKEQAMWIPARSIPGNGARSTKALG